jgi:glycerol-3-phosphate dehydrogenase
MIMGKNTDIATIDFCSSSRSKRLSSLSSTTFDLLVIGGGITGAGIARDATLRGFSVALVDKNDYAFGTSSRSSKMIHGGFRYLANGEFGLVRESEAERDWLRKDFPGLIRPFEMAAPCYKEENSFGMIRTGIFLYDLIDRYRNWKKGRSITDKTTISKLEPALSQDGLAGIGVLCDCSTDDARLTVENIKEAVLSNKCIAISYARVVSIEKDPATGKVNGAIVHDEAGDAGDVTIRAKFIVNATGIWTDELFQAKPAGLPDKIIRGTKGVHMIFRQADLPVNHCLGLRSHIDGRFLFLINRGSHVIVGTTDTDYTGPLDEPTCTREDAEYLLSTVRLRFPSAKLAEEDIIGTYAGIRPLVVERRSAKTESEDKVSRKHLVVRGTDGMFTVCGGKLTIFRAMAEDLLHKHVRKLAKTQLKGQKIDWSKNIARRRFLIAMDKVAFDSDPVVEDTRSSGLADQTQLAHLYGQYGFGAIEILDDLRETPSLAARLIEELPTDLAPWIFGEVDYVTRHEDPAHLVDVLSRRLEVAWRVHPDLQPAVARAAAGVMKDILGWDDGRVESEIEAYLEIIKRNSFFTTS